MLRAASDICIYIYLVMWRNVPSPWEHVHKATPGTSLSTSQTGALTNQRDIRRNGQRAQAAVDIPATLTLFVSPRETVLSHTKKIRDEDEDEERGKRLSPADAADR